MSVGVTLCSPSGIVADAMEETVPVFFFISQWESSG